MDNGSGLFNETPAVRERAKPRPRRAVGRRLVAAVAVVGGLAAAAYLYPDVTRTVWQKLGGLTQSASARVNADDKGSADGNGGGKAKASAPIAVTIAKAEKATTQPTEAVSEAKGVRDEASKIVANMTEYERKGETYLRIRNRVGNAIEKLMAK